MLWNINPGDLDSLADAVKEEDDRICELCGLPVARASVAHSLNDRPRLRLDVDPDPVGHEDFDELGFESPISEVRRYHLSLDLNPMSLVGHML